MPMVLYINTITNQYYLQLKGLARASIEGDKEELIRIRLKVFFLNFNFYPFKGTDRSKEKKPTTSKSKKRKRPMDVKRVRRILRTFTVKEFLLDFDSGNCITNAKLYPVFVFLNYQLGGFHINFQGRNRLVLQLQNRPIHILKSFINF